MSFDDPVPWAKVDAISYAAADGSPRLEPVTRKGPATTWLDLFRAADAAVRASEDLHHRYIERLCPSPDNPCVLVMVTGS